jgi:hypothetical protein
VAGLNMADVFADYCSSMSGKKSLQELLGTSTHYNIF